MSEPVYPVATSALILVDVLNEFLADDGKLNGAIAPMLEQTHLKANLQRLLDGARAKGVKVFFSPHGLDEHSFDGVKFVHPRFQQAVANKMFWIGSPGGEFYQPLAPRPNEFVVSHHRVFSSFHGTDLQQLLQANGIEKVIIAGLTSQTCVEGTDLPQRRRGRLHRRRAPRRARHFIPDLRPRNPERRRIPGGGSNRLTTF
jgi:nicotinamidase-related amidase